MDIHLTGHPGHPVMDIPFGTSGTSSWLDIRAWLHKSKRPAGFGGIGDRGSEIGDRGSEIGDRRGIGDRGIGDRAGIGDRRIGDRGGIGDRGFFKLAIERCPILKQRKFRKILGGSPRDRRDRRGIGDRRIGDRRGIGDRRIGDRVLGIGDRRSGIGDRRSGIGDRLRIVGLFLG